MNPFNDPTRDLRALPPAKAGLELVQGRVPMLPEPQTLYGVPVEKETHFWDGWLARGETWLREQLVRWIPVPPPAAPEATDDLMVASPLTDTFLKRVTIEPVRNARLVYVSFDSHYPDLAARV